MKKSTKYFLIGTGIATVVGASYLILRQVAERLYLELEEENNAVVDDLIIKDKVSITPRAYVEQRREALKKHAAEAELCEAAVQE